MGILNDLSVAKTNAQLLARFGSDFMDDFYKFSPILSIMFLKHFWQI